MVKDKSIFHLLTRKLLKHFFKLFTKFFLSFFVIVGQDETATYEVALADAELINLIASEGETLNNNVISGPTLNDDQQVTVQFDPLAAGVTSTSLTATDSRNNQSVAIIPVIIE